MTALTGTSSDKSSPGDVNIGAMQQKWTDGHPITVGSKDHTTGHLWWKDHQEYFDLDGQKVVSSNEYTVVGFGTANDHPGEVKLRNPWGSSSNATEYIWVSQDELNDNFGEVSIGND